jgi:TRAP-type C4-dicarboxylate transport system permease large subunit
VFAWAIGIEHIPQKLAVFMNGITSSPYVMLLIINIILIIVGMWMETSAAVLLFAPILAPIAIAMGVNPVHFAVIMILNLTIGLITPPVGVVLYATAAVGKIKFEQLVRSTLPFIILSFVALFIVTMFPQVSLFLPRLLGFVS